MNNKPIKSYLSCDPWSIDEIEGVISNAHKVLKALPDTDRRALSSIGQQVDVVRDESGNHSGKDDKDVKADLSRKIKVALPGYYIDQVFDVFTWVLWLEVEQRVVVWAAANYTGECYERLPWHKVASRAGIYTQGAANKKLERQNTRRKVKKIYEAALKKICERCNREGFKRRVSV